MTTAPTNGEKVQSFDPNQPAPQLTAAEQALEDFRQAVEESRVPLVNVVTQALLSGDASGRDAAIKKIDGLTKFINVTNELEKAWKAYLEGDGSEAFFPTLIVGPLVQPSGAVRATRNRAGRNRSENEDDGGDNTLPSTSKRQYIPWYLKAILLLPNREGTSREIAYKMHEIMDQAKALLPGDTVELTTGPRYVKRTDHLGADLVAQGIFERTENGYRLTPETGVPYVTQLIKSERGEMPAPPPISTRGHAYQNATNGNGAEATSEAGSEEEDDEADEVEAGTETPAATPSASGPATAASQVAPTTQEPVPATTVAGNFGEPPAG